MGEMEERGEMEEMGERGALKPVFREDFATVTLPVVWPSDALTRSLTLLVDKGMECDEKPLKYVKI